MTDTALCIYLETGPHCSEAELHDWYEVRTPSSQVVPGFQSVWRYRAIDDQKPMWLTIYNLDSPSAMKSEAYLSFRAAGAQRDAELLSKLSFLQRRLYQHITTFSPAPTTASSPGKYVIVICVQTTAEEEYNKWMDGEHMTLMSKVPGYLRGRRYRLVDQMQLKGETPENGPLLYFTVHELDRKPDANNQEFKYATSTPGFNKATQSIVDLEFRMFELV